MLGLVLCLFMNQIGLTVLVVANSGLDKMHVRNIIDILLGVLMLYSVELVHFLIINSANFIFGLLSLDWCDVFLNIKLINCNLYHNSQLDHHKVWSYEIGAMYNISLIRTNCG